MEDNTMFPEDRKLGEPERLRLFEADVALLRKAAKKLGVEDDEAKRRAVHIGVRGLADMLGIDVDGPSGRAQKKAA